jgi:hypothetical protein
MTAEEFRKTLLKEKGRVSEEEFMIEFAKLKVTEALKAASENADTIRVRYTNDYEIDKQSILTAYPLNLIK